MAKPTYKDIARSPQPSSARGRAWVRFDAARQELLRSMQDAISGGAIGYEVQEEIDATCHAMRQILELAYAKHRR